MLRRCWCSAYAYLGMAAGASHLRLHRAAASACSRYFLILSQKQKLKKTDPLRTRCPVLVFSTSNMQLKLILKLSLFTKLWPCEIWYWLHLILILTGILALLLSQLFRSTKFSTNKFSTSRSTKFTFTLVLFSNVFSMKIESTRLRITASNACNFRKHIFGFCFTAHIVYCRILPDASFAPIFRICSQKLKIL
jgi:hypothetical protein